MSNKPSTKKHALLDFIIEQQLLKNDVQLARFLDVAPPVISHIRSGRLKFGSKYILRLHSLTNWPIAKIEKMIPPWVKP